MLGDKMIAPMTYRKDRRWRDSLCAVGIAFCLMTGSLGAETLEEAVRARHFEEAMARIHDRLSQANSQERTRLLLLLADCQVQLSLAKDAQESLRAIDPRTAPLAFFRVRGQLQHLNGNDSLAQKDFLQALKLATRPEEKIRPLCELALLDSEVVGRERAEKLWSEALELVSSHHLSSEEWMLVYRTRYELLIRSGNPQGALDLCRLARVNLDGESNKRGLVWSYLGEINSLKSLGRFEDAEVVWHRALEASERSSAAVLLMWGYPTLYERNDTPASRRVLVELEKHWASSSEYWSEFERYHVRMLQAQIWLHGLDDPERGLEYLRLAEPLASDTARPSGDHMTVRASFHKFSDGPSSDIEQVLWLQLRCYLKLRKPAEEVNEFMEQKLGLLPVRERPAWLITLGKRYAPSDPKRAQSLFARAVEGTSGNLRGRLLAEMMDTFYELGQLTFARKKAGELQSYLSGLDPSESYEVLRYVVPQSLDREWSQSLWSRVWEANDDNANRRVFNRLTADSGQQAAFEKTLQQHFEQCQTSGDRLAALHALCLQVQLMILQGRYAEALALGEKGQKLDLETRNYDTQLEQLISYAHFRLDEPVEALRSVRRARQTYSQSERYSSSDAEFDCAQLEIGFLLDLQQFELALELTEAYQSWNDGQDSWTIALSRSYALIKLQKWEEALDALRGLEDESSDSLFAVAVKCHRAATFSAMGRKAEALEQLEAAWELAAKLESVRQCDVVLLWYKLDPKTAPLDAVAKQLRTLPDYSQDNPAVSRLLALAGLESSSKNSSTNRWLSQVEFLRQANELMASQPEMATTVPLLPASLVQQAKDLRPNEVKVEYYVGPSDLIMMVVASEGFAVHRLTLERKILEDWAARVRTDPAIARQLGRILIDPLEPECEGKTLTILGHGPLLSLPWDLLRLRDDKLVQRHQWRLWAGPTLSPQAAKWGGPYHVLALGGVRGSKLPASQREVEALTSTGIGSVEVLTGESATKKRLEELLPRAEVLHLATHSTPTEIELSDGALTIDEVYSLPLRPGALVVLSSCEGADPGGQERGPVNLAAAFLAAGASEVVAGTDRVADADAEALFVEFYKQLAAGLAPSAALQQAKLSRMAVDPDGDWSKFVLLGD
jgi:tetratricopeptide (TPR) repeat protein